ncbi:neutral zinc metallopeptidase [Plantactinospora sp. GCM10030261]|uniref:KPN_02809 family neutral zinc metallopeptidase n=1 Tax=Plantactinospora sp. GCM10030261 TaxID=3273420 RepID=UPI003611BF86
MELNDNADLRSGQVEDQRGSGGGGGRGGIPIPIGGGRGGLIGIILTVLVALVGGGFGLNAMTGGESETDNSSLEQKCAKSNPDRFQNVDCRNWLYVQSIQTFWEQATPEYFDRPYEPTTTRFFSGAVNTGCGQADSGVGPFYCPADSHVYIDLTFYGELSDKFGASGEFAAPYVLAHEYGHHMQNLLGTNARAQEGGQSGPESGSVRLELQADCYAGVWAHHATETKEPNGEALFKTITDQDIQEAVTTAEAIGDDTIQERSGRGVDPDAFTHGTSAQRKKWFLQGYNGGDPRNCDTFRGSL